MDTATTNMPEPIDVTIVPGSEYSDELWRQVTISIGAAESALVEARAKKRDADAAYEEAMRRRAEVQVPRDRMILTDSRSTSAVGRLAGVGRARCSQIRSAHRGADIE